VAAKLQAIKERRYIQKGRVQSLTSYFSVPTGDQDIHMVYDASTSGLNSSLWAPSFGLPTVDTLTRSVEPYFWMGGLDIGEMFLSFSLHPEMQEYCGVDLKPYLSKPEESAKAPWERWTRCVMGLKPSPY